MARSGFERSDKAHAQRSARLERTGRCASTWERKSGERFQQDGRTYFVIAQRRVFDAIAEAVVEEVRRAGAWPVRVAHRLRCSPVEPGIETPRARPFLYC